MDYEKLYKESLERAKRNYITAQDLYEGAQIGVECFKNTLESIFPEIKESEDDRIRKELVAFLEELSKLGKNTNFDRWKTSDCANWIAWLEKQVSPQMVGDAYLRGCDDTEKKWLEKQGEKKSSDEVLKIRQELYQSGYNDGYKHGIEDGKQGEQKVSYTTTVGTGDGGINALVTRDIEIPFGAKDSELQEATYLIPKGYYAKIEGDKVVIKKGEGKPATIDVDKMVDDYARSNVRDNKEFGKPLPCMIRAYRQGLNDDINEKNDGSERL